MTLTVNLDQPCPSCSRIGKYGNVMITGELLLRRCTACGYKAEIVLPQLNKRIIYLDQSFFSHAFRASLKDFVDAAKRIESMAKHQLICCPRSRAHEQETHLWRHNNQSALWKFIKQTSEGIKFQDPPHIKSLQLQRSLTSFLTTKDEPAVLLDDALPESVNWWSNYIWPENNRSPVGIEMLRKAKEESVCDLVSQFDEWQSNSAPFEDEVILEANGYARSLFELLHTQLKALHEKPFVEFFCDLPADIIIPLTLLSVAKNLGSGDSLSDLQRYLSSTAFRTTPFVGIASHLYAVLRKRLKMGQFSNRENALKELSGIFFDVEAISVFAPY